MTIDNGSPVTQAPARAAAGNILGGRMLLVNARAPRSAGPSEPEARLQRAQEAGGALPFEWDLRTDEVLAGNALKALFGLGAGEGSSGHLFRARIHPADLVELGSEYQRLSQAPGRFDLSYRVVLPSGARRWILSRGESLADETGAVTGLAGIAMDITGHKEIEDELRRSRREARSRLREVRGVYENALVGLALLDPDFRFVRVNALLAELNGATAVDHIGRSLFEVLPDLRGLEPEFRRVAAGDEPLRDVEVEVTTPSDLLRTTSLRIQCYPLHDRGGTLTGVGIVVQDITAQKRAEQAQELLSRELSHRIKNLFAVISSLVLLSARGDARLTAFAQAVRGRIDALARAHDLARREEGNLGLSGLPSLKGLLTTLLTPYRLNGSSSATIEIVGDDVALGPQASTALALAFHEFATNAAKYGALSAARGHLRVACTTRDGRLVVAWTERGGPPVTGAPDAAGFGSLLTRRSLVQDFGGEISASWAKEGLSMEVVLPLTALAR